MGHKKRGVAPCSKPSSPVVVATVGSVVDGGNRGDVPTTAGGNGLSLTTSDSAKPGTDAVVVAESVPSSYYSAIKLEWERALNAFRRGNHTKALRLIKDASHKYANSALIHRVHATVCVKVAGIIDNPNAKSRHLKNAIESAKKAVHLSPNSVEFAHFYANLLYEVANEAKEYEEVVKVCERAVSIENPIDPAKERLQDEQQPNSTPEGRIAQIQQELRSLIQKSNRASLSTWMKNLSANGEEKLRLIPISRHPEDPREVYVQTRSPNEIKKATKTPEDRRREIEVRVTAARVIQQKSDNLYQGQRNESKGNELNSAAGHRLGERRKHGHSKKSHSATERKDQVRSFWNSMTYETKKELLRVSVKNLRAYFSSSKYNMPHEIISEALSFAEVNRTWKFWSCCRCGDKFAHAEAYVLHVVQEHIGRLSPNMQSLVPPNVEHEWAEMLLSCSWKPLDLDASVRVSEQQPSYEDPKCGDRVYKENHKDNWSDNHCCEDTWDSCPENEVVDSAGSRENETAVKLECKECDPSRGSMSYDFPNLCPLSDDSDRAKLLEKIGTIFKLLVRHKCLAASLLHKVIRFTMDELQGLAPGSKILKSGLDQTPVCVRFLGSSQLRKILQFLQEVSHSSGVVSYPEKGGVDDANSGSQALELEEKIVLDENASCLFLDENLLPGGAGESNACSTASAAQLNSDFLLSWIFSGPSSGEELDTWARIRDEKSQEGSKLLQMLEKEFGHLQSLCDRKYEHLGYEEALQGLEALCVEASKKRNNAGEFTHCGFDSVLRMRKDELVDSENELMMVCNRFKVEAISNVLKEAENVDMNQFGYEEPYVGSNSHLCDLEAGEYDLKSKDYCHQVDNFIEVAIQRQKEQIGIELCKLDARIMRNLTDMLQLEIKLERISALDFRSILLPLVKSFLRAHLEDLAEKDATEKSDAAREAFLAELARDSKKGIGKGSVNSKSMSDRTKDKRKSKDSRKSKNLKASSFNGKIEITNTVSSATAYDNDDADSDINVTGSVVDLKDLEEELRQKIELEAEERKLEETLKYQRRIEYEAKQKHLAEQHIRNTAFEHTSEGLVNSSAQATMLKDLPCNQEVAKEKKLEGFQRSTVDGVTGPNTYSTIMGVQSNFSAKGSHPVKVRSGLSKGDIANDGGLPSDQQTRRRGRRKSSLKGPEGKYQMVSPGKENGRFFLSQALDQDGVSVGDSYSRTLRHLQAEEDDEERFQADLEKAVRQSLDTFQSHQPLASNSTIVISSQEVDRLGTAMEIHAKNENGVDIGTGLKNEVGEYNCFLNVIIQSLWHLQCFQEAFLKRSMSEHAHVGDPCVVCALYDILTALSMASANAKREAVAPTTLRVALSKLYPESNFFLEGQMNDASEVLHKIFECLHQSFTSSKGVSDATWHCSSTACIAHSLFGMDISERMNCYNCGLESRHLKYSSFFHNINASALRTMKAMCADSSFDELLNFVEMNHQLPCKTETAGCGNFNHIHHILAKPPRVFTTVLGWQTTCESVDDIRATLAALATEIDISALYRGLDPEHKHRLVSMVCYYGQHYHCFAYSRYHGCWILYDDKTVKVVGTWAEVLTLCERGYLQPQLLFYEAANL